MPKSPSRRLVIDASVAARAGDRRRLHPEGKRSRDFLAQVLVICHRMVLTSQIGDEWREHQQSFARKWRKWMYARKKVDCIDVEHDETLRRRIERVGATDKEREEMLKDCLLIEAALATDRRVASLDEKARNMLGRASEHVAELKRIVWVNPNRPEEHPITWLEKGAGLERERMLEQAR